MEQAAYDLRNTSVKPENSELPPCVVTYLPHEKIWLLEQEYAYRDRAGHFTITVRAGFRFDLASVPRPFWWLVSPFDLTLAGPLIHDFLYQCGGVADGRNGVVVPIRNFTREEVDRLFRDIMEREGVSAWRRSLAYAAVRTFGGGAWRRAAR